MEEELTVDPQYLKGFNNGYLLTKHEPKLIAQIIANPNDQNEYFKGLVGGKQEYEREIREWSQSFLKGSSPRDDRDIEKGR